MMMNRFVLVDCEVELKSMREFSLVHDRLLVENRDRIVDEFSEILN